MFAVAVASSGIAATLLEGGRTAHSMFKLPLDLVTNDSPMCNIKKGSGVAKVLEKAKLIIWDECTMAHRRAFEALDRTLQDIRSSDDIFGGVTVLISGDFRQTLPVVPRGTPADEVSACLKSSYLWDHVCKVQLSTNMRVHLGGGEELGSFSRKLIEIGNGTIPHVGSSSCSIKIPSECGNSSLNSIDELFESVYPNIKDHYLNQQWLRDRAILAPRNDTVTCLNDKVLAEIPGQYTTYLSVDETMDIQEATNYPTEFLNSLNPTGLPNHKICLKIGVPIMLLRNLDPPRLCNGTRLTVKKLMKNVIEATIITGQHANEDVLIPRIPLVPSKLPNRF